jgi:hypothetical protein
MTEITASSKKPRMTARDRDMRRIRIMSLLQAGYSYESIAEDVKLTRERVRQIVVKSLTSGLSGARIDPRLVQCARLEPALKLAASKVAEGDLAGIDRLLRVLDKLDKYGPIAVTGVYDEDARKKLLDRLDRAAGRVLPPLPPEESP